jgi:hypothetical protein
MTLDQESRADWDGKNWTVAAGSKRLTPEGMVEELQQP